MDEDDNGKFRLERVKYIIIYSPDILKGGGGYINATLAGQGLISQG